MAPVPSHRDALTASTPAHSSHTIKTTASSSSYALPPSPAHSTASASTDATFSSTLRFPDQPGATTVSHPVAKSDRQLHKLATETARAIPWDTIVRNAQSETSRWKWTENTRDFSVYTRQTSESYAVLATGAVPCSVPELVTVLHAVSGKQHLQKMSAVHGDQFKDGALVYSVDLESDRLRDAIQQAHDDDRTDDATITELSVRTATFTKSNWLHRHEEWCYVDAVRRHRDGEIFEKHMTSLAPKDLVTGKSDGRTKFLHDVVSGFLVKPDTPDAQLLPVLPHSLRLESKPVQLTRVQFYAEYAPPSPSLLHVPLSRSLATDKTVK